MATKTSIASSDILNAEAAVLKRRWSKQLEDLGEKDTAKDSPKLAKRLTMSGNCWSDCAEVEALHMACSDKLAGLDKDGAICQAASRYFSICKEREEFCQDPTEH